MVLLSERGDMHRLSGEISLSLLVETALQRMSRAALQNSLGQGVDGRLLERGVPDGVLRRRCQLLAFWLHNQS